MAELCKAGELTSEALQDLSCLGLILQFPEHCVLHAAVPSETALRKGLWHQVPCCSCHTTPGCKVAFSLMTKGNLLMSMYWIATNSFSAGHLYFKLLVGADEPVSQALVGQSTCAGVVECFVAAPEVPRLSVCLQQHQMKCPFLPPAAASRTLRAYLTQKA